MAVANRRDLQVLEDNLDALSDEVGKLANSPGDQARIDVSYCIRLVRADLEKLAATLRIESRGPFVEAADDLIEPVEDLLSEHPIATIAFGLGLGLVLGFAWR